MEAHYSPKIGCDHNDFSFAFNDSNFSDRVLHIKIFSDAVESSQAPPPITRVQTIHVSSSILAAKSPFFYKLFLSQQHNVTLQINASEEIAFIELLNFIYHNKLTVKTASDVLDVLAIADKFEVSLCKRCCARLLVTSESGLVYLDLPSTVLMSEEFWSLTTAVKQFYVVHNKDMTKFHDEIINLPLTGVEAIISSDALKVYTEDAVYSFVLKWARAHYPKIEDRREIIRTRLAKFIRYPYMTSMKLNDVLHCNEFNPIFAREVVDEALFFQAKAPECRHTYTNDKNPRFVERAYKYQPIKMVRFKHHPHHEVYMDLKHEVCASLFPMGSVRSESFNLGGHEVYLSIHCSKTIYIFEEKYFCFDLGITEKVAVSFAVDYELAIRSKAVEGFVTKCKGSYTVAVSKVWSEIRLFATPWRSFIGKDSVYFIDDVLHLRTRLNVKGHKIE